MPFQTLSQTFSNDTPLQQLAPGDAGFNTGGLDSCVAVVALGNPNMVGDYANVAGQHGGGGVHYLNSKAIVEMLQNVQNPKLIILPGYNQTVSDRKKIKDFANEMKAQVPGLTVNTRTGTNTESHALVNRRGDSQWHKLGADFDRALESNSIKAPAPGRGHRI